MLERENAESEYAPRLEWQTWIASTLRPLARMVVRACPRAVSSFHRAFHLAPFHLASVSISLHRYRPLSFVKKTSSHPPRSRLGVVVFDVVVTSTFSC